MPFRRRQKGFASAENVETRGVSALCGEDRFACRSRRLLEGQVVRKSGDPTPPSSHLTRELLPPLML
ncbi:hypothetical protein GN956_G15719 [Arapaima gigas]